MTRGWIRCHIGNFTLENNWGVEPGQVMVLFGASGSGKTTTLRAIAGLVKPIEGHVEIGGQVAFDSDTKTWVPPHRREVGYVTQEYHLFPHLSVSQNIAYGVNRQSSNHHAIVSELIQAFQLEGMEQRRSWELSGGQQQRVALARALATQPQVLLLDEPFSSLDADLRRTLRGEIRSVLGRSNIPVILVTHDREEALALGDSVQVIDQGRITERGEPLRVLGQPGQGRLARLVGVENTLAMQVESRHPQDGTMICVANGDSAGLRLEVPLSDLKQGQAVTVGIRASDIILAGAKLQSSSARNQLQGSVSSIELRPPGYEVTLECQGVPIRCHITGTSLSEMQIQNGMDLWAVFKASSCFLVAEENGMG